MSNRWRNSRNSDRLYFLGLQNHGGWWTAVMKLKMFPPWMESYDKPEPEHSYMSDSVMSHQAPLSMKFSKQEYWSGLPFLLQGIFPTHGSSLCFLHLLNWQANSLPTEPPGKPNLDSILKSRDITLLTKVRLDKTMDFPSSHAWMWDHKEGWALENWCFWTVVLEKTLESHLDSKDIKPVHPKRNQSWIFIWRTDAEAEVPTLWSSGTKRQLTGKDPDARKDWGQEEKGITEDEMVVWHYRLDGREFEWTQGDSEGQGSLACCNPGVTNSQIQLSGRATTKMSLELIQHSVDVTRFCCYWSLGPGWPGK